jgi:phage terminase large subunit
LADNDLYPDEVCYKTRMLAGDIVSELKGNRHKTISESADPRLIQEIANAGILICPVEIYSPTWQGITGGKFSTAIRVPCSFACKTGVIYT